MDEQIRVAAKWWTDQLRTRSKQDNGDALSNLFVGMMQEYGVFDVSAEQADVFEEALAEALRCSFRRVPWLDENPRFGSGLRAVGCDYHADRVLSQAAAVAGIPADCPPFPMKTIMWIDPDCVRVRHGYGAKVEVLWGEDPVGAQP